MLELRWLNINNHNKFDWINIIHYRDVIMSAMASQITSFNRLFRRRSKKTSKLRVTGLCVGKSPEAGEFQAFMASNAENASFWWRHHIWYMMLRYVRNCTKITSPHISRCHILICSSSSKGRSMHSFYSFWEQLLLSLAEHNICT